MSRAGASSWRMRLSRSVSTFQGAIVLMSEPRRAVSATASCSAAPLGSPLLDVAFGQLDLRLREDPRVTTIERFNARTLGPADLPFPPELITVDVSFISLTKVLPARRRLPCTSRRSACDGQAAVRAGSCEGRQGGRVTTPPTAVRRSLPLQAAAQDLGLPISGFASSGLPGAEGQPRDLCLVRGRRAGDRRTRGSLDTRGCEEVSGDEDRRADHPLAPARRDRGGRRRRRGRPRGGLAPGRHRRELDKHGSGSSGDRRSRRASAGPTSASCSAAMARSSMRCAASPAAACPSSGSTSAPSASSPRSSATRPRRASARACGRVRDDRAARP